LSHRQDIGLCLVMSAFAAGYYIRYIDLGSGNIFRMWNLQPILQLLLPYQIQGPLSDSLFWYGPRRKC
jgi:hypothetical protein